MADRNGYIGRAPGDSAVVIARQSFEPSGIQTNFTFSSGYTVGYLDAYFNGVRLLEANDYTATDGSTVGLTTYAVSGDVLEFVAYKAFNLGSVNNATGNFDVGGELSVTGALSVTGVSTFTGDLYVGGDLYVADDVVYDEVTGRNINISGVGTIAHLNVTGITTSDSTIVGTAVTTDSEGIRVAGVVTATSFTGSGANLTDVISGIEIQEEGAQVGTSITMVNFVGSDITATAAGSASTITVSVAVPAGWNELDAALFN